MSDAVGFHDSFIKDILVADLNEDGHEDIALSRSGNYGCKCVLIFFGNGDFTFSHPFTVYDGADTGTRPGRTAAADITGDGHLDVLVDTLGGTLLFVGDGGGGFHPGPLFSGEWPEPVGPDVNGDGYADRIEQGSRAISVFLNDGAGGFLLNPYEVPVDASPGGYGVTIADFTGDRLNDLLVIMTPGDQNATGLLYSQEGLPAASFSETGALSIVAVGVPGIGFFSADLLLVGDPVPAFLLQSVAPAAELPALPASFSPETGMLRLPLVEIRDLLGATSRYQADLHLVPDTDLVLFEVVTARPHGAGL
jgi:hypothetical protein